MWDTHEEEKCLLLEYGHEKSKSSVKSRRFLNANRLFYTLFIVSVLVFIGLYASVFWEEKAEHATHDRDAPEKSKLAEPSHAHSETLTKKNALTTTTTTTTTTNGFKKRKFQNFPKFYFFQLFFSFLNPFSAFFCFFTD
ncbi:hypothetical protein B9Z55_015668 [Caenorhabditis nigoni]|uniref:Transmembrane protein n=1 Tax=Caenorhabditis nigoni TaxID=1611254 RepID=A0A2G5UC32_9PELO|nr:hypothetical protein B9Z55_015668 [Caenorhabditis nigoni]